MLEGKANWTKQRPLAWEHEGNQAIRVGEWKLVREHNQPWELYNLEQDRTELNDLADGDHHRAQKLADLYSEWMLRSGAVPWPPGARGSWPFPGLNSDGSFRMRGHGHVIPRGFTRSAANANSNP